MSITKKKAEIAAPKLETPSGITECFVIMPISNQIGYEANHFQFVYEDIIIPAIRLAGMEEKRADNAKNTNLIQLDIVNSIINTPMAVCDMSAKNPNVFYELGMRQAFDKPTVLMRDEDTEAPFDISGLRYVTYSKNMSHRSVKKAIEELSQAISDTYAKRDDKSEVNSMIRLLELKSPAKLENTEVSDTKRLEILNNISMQEVLDKIDQLFALQARTMDYTRSFVTLEKDAVARALKPPSPPPPPPPPPRSRPSSWGNTPPLPPPSLDDEKKNIW
jgi:hypothetical protein